jgi:hypothetical protein
MLGKFYIISKKLMCSYLGAMFAQPSPKFSKAPSFIDSYIAEICDKNSQSLGIALSCQPKIDSFEKLCPIELHPIDIVKVDIIL